MLLKTYVTTFNLLILQVFYIKSEELLGHKLILILQGIILLFSKDSSIIIIFGYFSLSFVAKCEK